jgi:hypothetical protein
MRRSPIIENNLNMKVNHFSTIYLKLVMERISFVGVKIGICIFGVVGEFKSSNSYSGFTPESFFCSFSGDRHISLYDLLSKAFFINLLFSRIKKLMFKSIDKLNFLFNN